MSKKIEATLETRVSKKGTEYQVVVIKLLPDYEKLVFLEKAELALLNLQKTDNRYTLEDLDFLEKK